MDRDVSRVLIPFRLPFPFSKEFGRDYVTIVPFGYHESFLCDVDTPPPFGKDRPLFVHDTYDQLGEGGVE